MSIYTRNCSDEALALRDSLMRRVTDVLNDPTLALSIEKFGESGKADGHEAFNRILGRLDVHVSSSQGRKERHRLTATIKADFERYARMMTAIAAVNQYSRDTAARRTRLMYSDAFDVFQGA